MPVSHVMPYAMLLALARPSGGSRAWARVGSINVGGGSHTHELSRAEPAWAQGDGDRGRHRAAGHEAPRGVRDADLGQAPAPRARRHVARAWLCSRAGLRA